MGSSAPQALAERKWWRGYHALDGSRREGEFPANYVEVVQEEPSHGASVHAAGAAVAEGDRKSVV